MGGHPLASKVHLEPCRYVPSAKRRHENTRDHPVIPDTNPDADQDHPLYGRVIVFTGALKTRTRQQAWDDAARTRLNFVARHHEMCSICAHGCTFAAHLP
ncbi:MAG: hypothetical protein J2P25_03540 [Nocardiopsaceae bacterium]|nr:hypothetical protein [Nocardiopsaceae bacterium]